MAVFSVLALIGFMWNRQLSTSRKKIQELNYKLNKKVEELEELSITDALTDLYNRRHFDRVFEKELQRCKRNKTNFVFILLDVDKFKEYNDTYGHAKGDEALISIASCLQDISKRANDFAFRVGGEEFALITSDISYEDAFFYARSLKQSIENKRIRHKNNTASKYISVSMGLVLLKFDVYSEHSFEAIYKCADELLYKAKQTGRNKIEKLCIQ